MTSPARPLRNKHHHPPLRGGIVASTELWAHAIQPEGSHESHGVHAARAVDRGRHHRAARRDRDPEVRQHEREGVHRVDEVDLRNLMTAEEAYFADSMAYTDQVDCSNPPAAGSVPWCPSTGNTLDQLRLANGNKSGWTARETNANTAISCAIYVGNANPLRPAKNSDPDGMPVCQ